MGKIYEEIEVEGEKVRAKIDTASDFPLALRKELIDKLELPKHPTIKASVKREENGKTIEELEPSWTADIKIRECKMTVPIVEARGDNLIGNVLLQRLKATIDTEKDKLTIKECPVSPWTIDSKRRMFELMGNFVLTGSTGEFRGKIIE